MFTRKSIVLMFLVVLSFSLNSCKIKESDKTVLDIISQAAENPANPFYIDKNLYKTELAQLPIGVFDSGTGGLAVLEAIITLDEFNNETHLPGSDSIPDFVSESFTYLADEANMPYGKYDSEGKAAFLKELVVKDVLFLLGTKYFTDPAESDPQTDKSPVKEIVIACNTATAFGLETVREAIRKWDVPVRITGIIEAGAISAIRVVENKDNKDALIAVFATEGTCSSGGYPNTIAEQSGELLPTNDIKVIQQAGIGLAGAIDGDINYLDPGAKKARKPDQYFGPGIENKDYPLNMHKWYDYNFAGDNEIFIETGPGGDTTCIQLNSVRNYVRYMVTSLVHNVVRKYPDNSIDVAILGCTHYPFEEDEIRSHFKYLKRNPEYRDVIPDSIILIDPSKSLASILYTNLSEKDLIGNNSINNSSFYISVPNTNLEENIVDGNMEFPYDWKYGRDINSGLRYVKIVPFSDQWIDKSIMERIRTNLPSTYKILQ